MDGWTVFGITSVNSPFHVATLSRGLQREIVEHVELAINVICVSDALRK